MILFYLLYYDLKSLFKVLIIGLYFIVYKKKRSYPEMRTLAPFLKRKNIATKP